jgi:hypothetical protein
VKARNTSLCAETEINNVDAEAKATAIEADEDIIIMVLRQRTEQDATIKETNPRETIPEKKT